MTPVRRLGSGDEPALRAFLAALPPEDRTFIKEDVNDPGTAGAWVAETGILHGVAVAAAAVVGLATVIPGVGWSSHVGDLRLVVHPADRRSGLGSALARWAVVEATRIGLAKLVVEVVAEQEAAVAMFEQLGFEPEALLRDHIRDRDGHLRDLLLLTLRFDGDWSGLATLGIGQ